MIGFAEIIVQIKSLANKFITWVKNLPNDEKAAWGSIVAGFVLVIVGIILW